LNCCVWMKTFDIMETFDKARCKWSGEYRRRCCNRSFQELFLVPAACLVHPASSGGHHARAAALGQADCFCDAVQELLMERFYQNLLGKREDLSKPLGKAAALAEVCIVCTACYCAGAFIVRR
jgi:hypothetical protein